MSKHYDHIEKELGITKEPELEDKAPEIEVEAEAVKFGKVCDCTSLNVRKDPSMNSDVVVVINYEAELKIIENFENPKWYKVVTMTGDEGYAMKQYVAVKE